MATPPFLPDQTKPGASDLISLYPSVEQTFRDVIESWILVQHNTTGTHKQVTLDDIATPTIAADKVGLWHESGVLKTRFAGGTAYDVVTSNTGLLLTGGTLTGDLVLSGAPDADLKAATKKYADDADALKANLSGPTFTGDPKAPTPSAGDNDTSIATTAFVQGEIISLLGTATVSGTPATLDLTGLAGRAIYYISLLNFSTASSSNSLIARLHNGSSFIATGYKTAASTSGGSSGETTSWKLTRSSDISSGDTLSGNLMIMGATGGNPTFSGNIAKDSTVSYSSSGRLVVSGPFTGIQILASTGNLDAGTIEVWG